MSDSYEYWMFPDVPMSQVAATKQRVLQALWSLGAIGRDIEPDRSLGGKEVYRPGAKLRALFTGCRDIPDHLERLRTNGVEVSENFGFRGVEMNSIDDLECPQCRDVVKMTVMWDRVGEAAASFHETSEMPSIECPTCAHSADARSWKSTPALSFTRLGLIFWNWPGFTTQLDIPQPCHKHWSWSFDIPALMQRSAASRIVWSAGRI